MTEDNLVADKFTFSKALDLLKEGERVRRAGWYVTGAWLGLVQPLRSGPVLLAYHLNVGPKSRHWLYTAEAQTWIGAKTADNKFVPWAANHSDLLAEDWVLVAKDEE